MELSILCACDVSLIIVCDGKLYDYSSSNLPQIMQKYTTFDKVHETYVNDDYTELYTTKDKKQNMSAEGPTAPRILHQPAEVAVNRSLSQIPLSSNQNVRHNQSIYAQPPNSDIRGGNGEHRGQHYPHSSVPYSAYPNHSYTDQSPQISHPISSHQAPPINRQNAFTPTTEKKYEAAQKIYHLPDSRPIPNNIRSMPGVPHQAIARTHKHPPTRSIHQQGSSLPFTQNNMMSIPRIDQSNMSQESLGPQQVPRKRKLGLNLKITVPVPKDKQNRVPVRLKSENRDQRGEMPVVDGNMSSLFPPLTPTLSILQDSRDTGIQISSLPVTPSSSKVEGLVWTPTPKLPNGEGIPPIYSNYCMEPPRKIQKTSHYQPEPQRNS